MKKIIALIISVSMVMAASPVSAAVQQIDGAEAYGKTDKKTEAYIYKDPEVTIPEKIGAANLPEKYDLRDEGRSTSVKDQKDHAFCWTFATMASLESNLITNKLAGSTVDLSEAHLAYYGLHGERNDTFSKYGGRDSCKSLSEAANYFCAVAALARGYGAVKESDFPYSAYSGRDPEKKYISDNLMIKSDYELKNAVFIGAEPTQTDYDKPAVDTVKRLMMENGAIAARMDFPDGNKYLLKEFGEINVKKLKAFYEKEEDMNYGSAHAITLIGWDDTFNDFPSAKVEGGNKPAGPGAWIVKDSYGTDMHGDGYFYMSYYSACLFQYASFQGQKNTGRQIYQYDGIGIGENMMRYDDSISAANTYTARTDLMLDQLATYNPGADCTVNFKVYVNQDGKNPVSGSKVYDKTFRKTYTGYSRTDMGQKVAVAKGTKFSIIVTTKTKDGQYYAPFEVTDAVQPTYSPAAVRPGQSYIKVTGKSAGDASGKWNSVTYKTILTDAEYGDDYKVSNALAKGFGMKGGTAAQKIKIVISKKAKKGKKAVVKKGKKLKLKVKRIKGNGKLYFSSSNVKKATVSAKGVVKAKKKGTVKVTVYAFPTTKYKSVKKTITVKIK